MRVLVVDDSPGVRRRLVALMREANLDVVGEAGDASAALVIARAQLPDAIVLEVLLAGRTDLSVLVALRAAVPGAIILILTNAPWSRRHCLALGAHHVLDKSIDFDQAVATLTGYIATA